MFVFQELKEYVIYYVQKELLYIPNDMAVHLLKIKNLQCSGIYYMRSMERMEVKLVNSNKVFSD